MKHTQAEKKRSWRAERVAKGYKEVTVWVAAEQVSALREFARALPTPAFENTGSERQLTLPLAFE